MGILHQTVPLVQHRPHVQMTGDRCEVTAGAMYATKIVLQGLTGVPSATLLMALQGMTKVIRQLDLGLTVWVITANQVQVIGSRNR